MKPLRPRYSKIDRLVAELLSENQVHGPAIPIHKIAESCGAAIQIENFNNEISGLLLRTPQATTIAVEKSQAPTRQRFTIAHELGHLLLHDGEEVRIDRNFRLNFRSPESSTAEDIEEIEANAFAASILMPASMLEAEVKQLIFDFDDEDQIKSLADRYKVSAQAMTIRLMNLFGFKSR